MHKNGGLSKRQESAQCGERDAYDGHNGGTKVEWNPLCWPAVKEIPRSFLSSCLPPPLPPSFPRSLTPSHSHPSPLTFCPLAFFALFLLEQHNFKSMLTRRWFEPPYAFYLQATHASHTRLGLLSHQIMNSDTNKLI